MLRFDEKSYLLLYIQRARRYYQEAKHYISILELEIAFYTGHGQGRMKSM